MEVISCRLDIINLTVLILASILVQQEPVAASDAVRLVLEKMEASKPDWLPDLDMCPVDVMPAHEIKLHSIDRCSTGLERCLDNCRTGDANDCYASALVLQKVRENPVSDALFLKACALGIVSGCTNRAAGMEDSGRVACVIQTFRRGCDYNDPWACTMLGFHLLRGIGVAKDHERARQAFSKSCRFGETDQACSYARRLMTEIRD